jgi:hypothetical protein
MNDVIAIIWLAVEVVSLIAAATIIEKAGFSSVWILVPLVPLALTVVLYFQEIHGLSIFAQGGSGLQFSRLAPVIYGQMLASEGSVGLSFFSLTYYVDLAATVIAWLFFLYFAFVPWPARVATASAEVAPINTVPTKTSRRGAQPAPAPQPVVPVKTSSLSGMNAKRFGRTPVAAPSVESSDTDLKTDEGPNLEFCRWCGKERPIDSFAIHYCGSNDRPVAFCPSCGGSVAAGSTECASCGAGI